MHSTSRRPLARTAPSPFIAVLSLAMASGIAFTNAGCGQTACLQWSENERISPTQICPASNEALKQFGTCTDIVSVDDEGSYANDLCCYSVTKVGQTASELGCNSLSTGSIITPDSGGFPGDTAFAVSTGFGMTSGSFLCDNQFDKCGDVGTGCIGCAFAGPCNVELERCTSNKGCTSFLDCLSACPKDDDVCADACGTQEPNGLMLYVEMVQCSVCSQCSTTCSAMAEKSCFAGSSSTSTSTDISSTGSTSSTSTAMGGGGGAGGMSGG